MKSRCQVPQERGGGTEVITDFPQVNREDATGTERDSGQWQAPAQSRH